MNNRQVFDALMEAASVKDVEKVIHAWMDSCGEEFSEVPVGNRPNNRGAIEVASDPGRSLIERVTNAHDALLEFEHDAHGGKPECRSPREAASAWLGVPERDGLAGLTVKQRQDLATHAIVRLEPGEGRQSRVMTVIDRGCGISAARMPGTILSLNESNKIEKHYLAGTYGQGGSSTYAFSRYVLIASRADGSDEVAFTVVRYMDLPADQYKTGRYVHVLVGGSIPTAKTTNGDLPHGTIVRHFGYDLSNYDSPIGPRSVYGALQRVLFDPVAPVRLENKVHGWNRVIKGARNALNGAIDGEDEGGRSDMDHSVPLFNVSLGDHGEIGIEYWLLKRPTDEKGKRTKSPADAFVDSRKPIVLTHNGQNQGERTARLLKVDADLPFLDKRLICHINCDRLSPFAKRLLFSSTRESSREGFVLNRIEEELVRLLRADDELVRLNQLARDESLKDRDEDAEKQMRRQVAKLLRIAGAALVDVGGSKNKGGGAGPIKKSGIRKKPEPITPVDPPTYIRIVWDEESDITFHSGYRRYIRIETDANSDYHDSNDATKSRINIALGDDLKVFGTSPLRNGRMRVGVECKTEVVTGSKGSIRIELYRSGQSTLSDERGYEIIVPPQPKDADRQSAFPDFELIPVTGPEEADWNYVCGDSSDDTDIERHASGAVWNSGKLYIYYSTAFPRFATEMKRLEQTSAPLAGSFEKRYKLWLAVHALLVYQHQQESAKEEDDSVKEAERQERCRLATVAVMMAAQEIRLGVNTEDSDSEAAA
jgi:hypothetical protein